MELTQVIKNIEDNGYSFEVVRDGRKLANKTTVDQAKSISGSVLKYIQALTREIHGPVEIKLFSKNGTSYNRRGDYVVEVATKSVEPSTEIVEPATKTVEHHHRQTLSGTDNTMVALQNATLTTENIYLKDQVKELKDNNRKLEQRNDALQQENNQLVRSNATMAEKSALDVQKAILEVEKGHKSGLSGIVQELKSVDPMTAAMVISTFKPDSPAADFLKRQNGGGNAIGNPDNCTCKLKHPNPDVQEAITAMIQKLLTVPDEVAFASIMLVQGLSSKTQKELEKIIKDNNITL